MANLLCIAVHLTAVAKTFSMRLMLFTVRVIHNIQYSAFFTYGQKVTWFILFTLISFKRKASVVLIFPLRPTPHSATFGDKTG